MHSQETEFISEQSSMSDDSSISEVEGDILHNNYSINKKFEEHKVPTDWKKFGGNKGIQNLGNTCFLNAALQALAHLSPIKSFFLESYIPRIRHQADVSVDCLFENFIKNMWSISKRDSASNERSFFTKADLVSQVIIRSIVAYTWRNFKQFSPGDQHDAQEFLHCFLNDLHESLKFPDNSHYDVDFLNNHCDSNHNLDLSSISILTSLEQQERKFEIISSLHRFSTDLVDNYYAVDKLLTDNKIEDFISLTKKFKPLFSKPLNERRPFDNNNDQLKSSIDSGPNTDNSKLYFKNLSKPKYLELNDRSIIRDIFYGVLENSIKCTGCLRVSKRMESFQDLSIPISKMTKKEKKPPFFSTIFRDFYARKKSSKELTLFDKWAIMPVAKFYQSYFSFFFFFINMFHEMLYPGKFHSSYNEIELEDCLKMFFNTELLENENCYYCTYCEKFCKGIKRIRIHHLPEVLMIHLNRYENINSNLRKINSKINFPMYDLSLHSFMCSKTLKKDDEDYFYQLAAVICHNGTQLSNGHYICYAYHDEFHVWFEFDDSRVRQVSVPEVLNSISCNAYILFYERNFSNKLNHALNVIFEIERIWLEKFSNSLHPFRDYYFLSRPNDYVVGAPHSCFNPKSFLVSRYWLYRFRNYSDPGPMNNSDIFCPHSLIRPTEWLFFNSKSLPLIEPVGHFFWYLYGGGPIYDNTINEPICQFCIKALNDFRQQRLEEFSIFNSFQTDDGPIFRSIKITKSDSIVSFLVPPSQSEVTISELKSIESGESICKTSTDVSKNDDEKVSFVQHSQSSDTLSDYKSIESDEDIDTNNESSQKSICKAPTDVSKNEDENISSMQHSQSSDTLSDYKSIESDENDSNNNVDVEKTSIVDSQDEEKNSLKNQLVLKSEPSLKVDKVDIYDSFTSNDNYYYLVSSEWMDKWLRFINVDYGHNSVKPRERQLSCLYDQIMKNNNEMFKKYDFHSSLKTVKSSIHPPLASLIKSFISCKDIEFETEIKQVWRQVNYFHHTIFPPTCIDNWSSFGIKQKLLNKFEKLFKTQSIPVLFKLLDCEEFTKLIAQLLKGKDVCSTMDNNPFIYSFALNPKCNGIAEEKSSCSFYVISKDFWLFLYDTYGGGPVIKYNFVEPTGYFEFEFNMNDLKCFLSKHLKCLLESYKVDKVIKKLLLANNSKLKPNDVPNKEKPDDEWLNFIIEQFG